MADIMLTVGMDPQEAIDKANNLQTAIKDIFDKTSGKSFGKKFDKQLNRIKQQINSTALHMEKLKRAMEVEGSKNLGFTPQYQKELDIIKQLKTELRKYKKEATDQNLDNWQRNTAKGNVRRTNAKIKYREKKLQNLEASDQKYISGKTSDKYKELGEQLGNDVNKMNTLVSAAKGLTSEADKSVSAWNKFNERLSNIKATASKIVGAFKKIATPIAKSVKALGKFGSRLLGINKASEKHNMSLKKMVNQVLRYGLGIRSIFILWRKLRAYTADALKLMATQFEEVDADVSALMNSFNQMKLSFGTMAQPLMHALRPALIYIIELITRATTALANFFAILTGQKFIYKAQKANDSYADSIGGVGSAAKEANKELAEYDNLLVIKSPNDGSGGGGGGAADGLTGTFEKTLAESDFAKQLKEAIERGDWEGVGSAFAEKLNIITEKFDNWINKKFRPKGVEWSKRIGRILNGWVDTWDGELFGKTVGDSLMSVMDIVATWWEIVKWKNLGKKVADAVNGLFTSWEPKTVARFFTGKINAVIDFAAGMFDPETGVNFDQMGTKLGESIKNFIEDIHWDTLGADLSNLANGILTGLSSAIVSSNLGTTVGNAINKFLGGIDFAQLATNLSDLAINILDALADVIITTDWKAVGEAIADFLTHIDWLGLIGKLAEVALALLGGLAEALTGLASNPDAIMMIAEALIAIFAVKKIWSMLTGLFSKNLGTAITSGISLAKVAVGAATFDLAGRGAGALFSGIASLLGEEELAKEYGEFAKGPAKYLVNAVSTGVEAAKEYSETTGRSTLSNAVHMLFGEDITGMAIKSAKDASDAANETFQRAQYSYDVLGLHELVSDEDWEKFKNSCDDYVAEINRLQEAAANGASGMSDYADKYKQSAQGITEGNEEIVDSTGNMNNQMSDYSYKYKESIYGMTDYSEKYKNEAPADIEEGNQEITESFYTMTDYIPPAVKEAMEQTADNVNEALAPVPEDVYKVSTASFANLTTPFDETKSSFDVRAGEMVSSFDNTPTELGQMANTSMENIKSGMAITSFSDHFGAVKDSIQTPFQELPSFFSDTFRESWNEAESAFSSGNTTFNNFNAKLSEGMTNTINGLIGGLNSAVSGPLQRIQEVINKFKNVKIGASSLFSNLPSFSNIPHIPMLAQGAVIPPNREFLAMLGDQTSGTNIETPLATMVQAFKQALSEMGSSNNQNIVLQLDGRTVAQCVWDEEDKRYKQTGRR